LSTLCKPNVNPTPVLKKKNVNPMSTLCKPNVNPIPENSCKKKSSKIYTCEFSNKDFKKRQGKSKHLKNHCKVKIESKNKKEYWRKLFEQSEKKREQKEFLLLQSEKEKESILQEKQKKEDLIDSLIKQIETLLTKVGTNNNNTTINQNNNIILRNLGEENLSYLTNNFFIKLIDAGPFVSIPRIVKRIHFNEKHPENMNLKVTDKTKSHIAVYEENKWKIKDIKDTIKDIVTDKFELIDGKYEEVKSKLDDNKQRIYKQYKNRVESKDRIQDILKDTEKIVLENN